MLAVDMITSSYDMRKSECLLDTWKNIGRMKKNEGKV